MTVVEYVLKVRDFPKNGVIVHNNSLWFVTKYYAFEDVFDMLSLVDAQFLERVPLVKIGNCAILGTMQEMTHTLAYEHVLSTLAPIVKMHGAAARSAATDLIEIDRAQFVLLANMLRLLEKNAVTRFLLGTDNLVPSYVRRVEDRVELSLYLEGSTVFTSVDMDVETIERQLALAGTPVRKYYLT